MTRTGRNGESDGSRMIRTRCVQAGHGADEGIWPLVPPIVQSTVYASHDPGEFAARRAEVPAQPTYSRDHFPNARLLESVVAELEGAEAGYAVASGMAAISLVALALLGQGDHLVIGADSYSDSEELMAGELARFGIACSIVNAADPDAVTAAIRPETRLIFGEIITNPGMVVADLDALSTVARRHGIPLVIDNTFASPALCRPMEHGADLVVHSVTKFLGGHHDLSAGVVVGDLPLMGRIQRFGYLLGAIPGSTDASLAVRGIRTLAARMAWISDSASHIACWLSGQPGIAQVRYPGLAQGADAEVVKRMLPDGHGGVFVVEFAGDACEERVVAFVRALRMIPYAPSLGGEITTVCFPPSTAGRSGAPCRDRGMLRFSIGLEHPDDIIDDISEALVACAPVEASRIGQAG